MAQFGANTGHDRFQKIYELPKKLAKLKDGKSVLERLFQPQPGTSRLFSLLMSGLEREGKFKRSWHRRDRSCKLLALFRCRCGSHAYPAPLGRVRHRS